MSKRVLTRNEELEIVIAYLGRVPIKDISERYQISRSGIHRVIVRMGHETDRGKKASG